MASSSTPADHESIAVLICDDNESMRRLLRIVFELQSNLVVVGEAANGDEAVVLARELQPDVILLDLSMPVRTGLHALPEIRIVAPASAVIAFSGLDESIVSDAAREAGAYRFLQKGADPQAIVRAIEEAHLGPRAGSAAAAQSQTSATASAPPAESTTRT